VDGGKRCAPVAQARPMLSHVRPRRAVPCRPMGFHGMEHCSPRTH
jgi:hypothetical protein